MSSQQPNNANNSNSKPPNDIRVGFRTRVGNIISYCEKLLNEQKMRTLNLSAVGGSIGTLVSAVEVLKATTPGLYQINRIATISYQSVEENKDPENQRLYPKLEVILTLDKPEKPNPEGFQDKLSEENRKKLLDLQNKRREERRNRLGRGRRGNRRGGFRGRRGNFRGRRGGFRGNRRIGFRSRGGFRGRNMRGNRRVGFRARGGRGMRRGSGGRRF